MRVLVQGNWKRIGNESETNRNPETHMNKTTNRGNDMDTDVLSNNIAVRREGPITMFWAPAGNSDPTGYKHDAALSSARANTIFFMLN